MEEQFRRRSQISWGIALLAGVFLLETWNAHRVMPNPASPYVWAFLATVGVSAPVAAIWYFNKAKAAAKAQPK